MTEEESKKFTYNIYLIGFMGTGKSTVSQWMKKQYGLREIEMDAIISDREGMPVTEIFEKNGEEYFRDAETALLQETGLEKNQIISCGGGVVLREKNIEIMRRQGVIVRLAASPHTVYERVKNSTSRPILNDHMNEQFIEELMEKRRAFYEKAADVTVSTDNKTAEEICAELVRKLELLHRLEE